MTTNYLYFRDWIGKEKNAEKLQNIYSIPFISEINKTNTWQSEHNCIILKSLRCLLIAASQT